MILVALEADEKAGIVIKGTLADDLPGLPIILVAKNPPHALACAEPMKTCYVAGTSAPTC